MNFLAFADELTKIAVGDADKPALAAYGAHRLQPTVLPNAIESIKNRWSGNE